MLFGNIIFLISIIFCSFLLFCCKADKPKDDVPDKKVKASKESEATEKPKGPKVTDKVGILF